MKMLIGSPIRQKPQILRQFLIGLEEADLSGLQVSCFFVDDNTDEASSALLREFARDRDCILRPGRELEQEREPDSGDGAAHIWDTGTIRKIAFFKDSIIEYAISEGFDYLFFVDSDIVIDRRTVKHLISRDVEIVSNVFWTQWKPNWDLEPQCFWMPDLTMQTKNPFEAAMPLVEARQLRKDFFAKMRIPGIYRVDGLGACTMVKRSALEKGVRFQEIPNLSLMGEDRHFCARAGALGIDLYFDTVYPVYHIYREEYLDRVEEFKRTGFQFDMCQTFLAPQTRKPAARDEWKRVVNKSTSYVKKKLKSKIKRQDPELRYTDIDNTTVAALIVVDERSVKYLPKSLAAAADAANFFLVYDAAGGAAGICAQCLHGKPYEIVTGSDPADGFRRLWEKAGEMDPGWILALSADEVLQASAGFPLRHLVGNRAIHAYYLRCFDIWDEGRFRSDALWPAYSSHRPYLMRFRKDYPFSWTGDGTMQKFPEELWKLSFARMDLHVWNYRWADADDRAADYAAGVLPGAGDAQKKARRRESLLDPAPVLLDISAVPDHYAGAEKSADGGEEATNG